MRPAERLFVLTTKCRRICAQQSASSLNFVLDQLARVLRGARRMRSGRHLQALPHQLIRHRLAHCLLAALPRGIPRALFASRLHQELPVATPVHPDALAIVPPRRTFHAWRRAYLSHQLHLGALRIRFAILLSPVERSAAYPLASDPSFPGAGRVPRYAHHKFRLASFVNPYPASIVSPRGAFLAFRVAPLSRELYPVAGICRANFSPAIIRRTRYRPRTALAAGIAAVFAASQSKLTAAPFVHPDSFFVIAPRLVLFAHRLAALTHQSRAIPRVRRAVVLLPVIRRTRNNLALPLLRPLVGQCPGAEGGEGCHQSKNRLDNSHAILLRLFE